MLAIEGEGVGRISQEPKSVREAKNLLVKIGYTFKDIGCAGVDFLACPKDGSPPLKVHCASRVSVYRYRESVGIVHMCFPVEKDGHPTRWYLIPHDKLLEVAVEQSDWLDTRSWKVEGYYNSGNPSECLLDAISNYEIPNSRE